ncbi:MAG: hypothetical protein JWM68_1263 [Verrucomicrobiales bacterium]|nr:hypothetical protein [Verrucomicrobiales bacterium]
MTFFIPLRGLHAELVAQSRCLGHFTHFMTEQDVIRIESKLDVRLPATYREFILSDCRIGAPLLFSNADDVIRANEMARISSWLGRPLPRSFFIFGADEKSRALFLDLDFPEPPVLVADQARQRGTVRAASFYEWIHRGESHEA